MAVANDTAGHGRHRRPLVQCPWCGVAFLAGMTGGRRQIHCSSACEVAARKRRNAQLAGPWKILDAVARAAKPRDIGLLVRKACRFVRRASKCMICADPIPYEVGRPAISCSTCKRAAKKQYRATYLASPSGRKIRRAAKSLRRARQRGLMHQSIDPILVFERDRWRCKLCGTRAPKAKRGTIDPDAPELDHIVPLALGGTRTWGNVQCACRACNQKKGATPLGQVGFDFAA